MRRAGSSKQGVDDAAAQQQLAPSLSEPIEPTPENVLAGLEVQEKSLRELRKYLFTRLFQLQVSRRGARHRTLPGRSLLAL